MQRTRLIGVRRVLGEFLRQLLQMLPLTWEEMLRVDLLQKQLGQVKSSLADQRLRTSELINGAFRLAESIGSNPTMPLLAVAIVQA